MAEVQLPQLGESVTEGVITAWLVEVGDSVEKDQPIVEISTDKVDTEIPSPVAGTVQELKAGVDDTVEVGAVIAVIGEGDANDAADKDADNEGAADEDNEGAEDEAEPAPEPKEPTAPEPTAAAPQVADGGGGVLMSPLVRKLLREAGIGPDQVEGTGLGGRITREDAERAIASGGEHAKGSGVADQPAAAAAERTATPPPAVQAVAGTRERPLPAPTQIDFGGEREVTQDLTRVRKAIAKAMMHSMQTTAQLTAAVEVDMTAIMNLRSALKDDFKARQGVSLSPLPFVCRAVTMTLPRHPTVNSSMDLEAGTATFHRYINLGLAVDTERGLLVPNIKDAQDLTVAALAHQIADVATRTRSKGITPDELSGATFTVTNTGSVGTLFDTPILNPPEVAILAACAIEKRPVVVSDAYGDSIAIRWMTYLCMSYDHRMLDGADAARFLQDLKWVLENHDFLDELGL